MTTLYERLGGEAAIDTAVEAFYRRVLEDERVSHYFQGLDMERQRHHQKAFMTYAFGGAPQWEGRPMRAAHTDLVTKMGLNDSHFDAIAEDLVLTLEEMGVPAELIDEVVAVVGAPGHRADVLNR